MLVYTVSQNIESRSPDSSMFGQLSTTLTLLSALFLANLADGKDFDWDIEPQEGSPAVAFNNFTTTKEVVFRYDSPMLYENKTYGVTVFQDDCKTIGSDAITHLEDASVDREITVLLDLDQGTISNSTYYKEVNITNAVIGLCLRVDYFLYGDSINFHETNLTINIDLTAGFNITSLEQMRIGALQDAVNVNLDYPVVAYHCDELNDKLAITPDLTQGDALQLCVELDPTVVNGNVFVTDILSVDLDQEKMDQNVTHKTVIDEALPDFLTSKLCQGGICNVKTQLDSSWFSDPIPGDINASGIAILAFGSNGQRLRFLRAPIVFQQRRHVDGSERDRKLQQSDDGNVFANFTLSTSLNIPSSEDDDKTPELLFVGVALMVGVALLVVSLFSCYYIIHRFGRKTDEAQTTIKSEFAPKLESTPSNEDSVATNTPLEDNHEAETTIKSELAPELESTSMIEDSVAASTPLHLLLLSAFQGGPTVNLANKPAHYIEASEATSEADETETPLFFI
jgi:hypothetical protein